ncbi:MAG: hypothetical protein HY279_09815 [Nitrospinae bacterium]|nr:hypothetical protein [Nitrospinota bacterium]
MTKIEDAQTTICNFLKKILHPKNIRVIKETRVNGGWEADAEVYEESSFIKSLGLPSRVLDRHIYSIRLDENLEVLSYELKGKE